MKLTQYVFRTPAKFDAGRIQPGSSLEYLWAGETLRDRQKGHNVRITDANGVTRIVGPRQGSTTVRTPKVSKKLAAQKQAERKLSGDLCPRCFVGKNWCFCADLVSTGFTAPSTRANEVSKDDV